MIFSKRHTRDRALDLLKAVAVVAMLLAHAENIFNDGRSSYLHLVDTIGSTLAFTLFVFASGISSYYAYYSSDQSRTVKLLRMMRRGLQIYLVYVILNLIVLYSSNTIDLDHIISSLTFATPQIYTEFLIPLIFLPFWVILIKPLARFFFHNIYICILFILTLFFLGFGLSNIQLSNDLQPYFALIVGSKDIYRYPILQYSVVFLIGLRFAAYVTNINTIKTHIRDIGQLVLLFGLLLASLFFINSLLPEQYNLFLRWPPGLGFMLIGVELALVVYFIFHIFPNAAIFARLSSIGEIALMVFVIHAIAMFTYSMFINYIFNNVILAAVAMLCFVIFSILLSKTLTNIFRELIDSAHEELGATYLTGILAIIFLWLILGLIYVEAKTIKKFPSQAEVLATDAEDKNKVPNIDTNLSRKWIIKNSKLPDTYTQGIIGITLDNPLHDGDIAEVNIDDGKNVKTFPAEKLDDFNYQFIINGNLFAPGDYEYQVVVNSEEVSSTKQQFKISYPLFVTWSIDYEGYEVDDKTLNAIGAIGDKYSLPITHMFNPRIYMAPEISDARRKAMTDFVLNRYANKNDEIGMHMHMQYDMVEAMGLVAKTTPKWGGHDNGHDVLTSAYDYNEFTAMLLWAKDQFAQNGLPVPTTYRAGGWYIEEPQLQALQDNGFTIDTSGRTAYKWGPNAMPGPWTLKETTVPYHPSTKDQNKSTPDPVLSLWEFPNNGWDSTNNDTPVLKKAFDLNYQGKTLDHAQTLTYLSHPTYFTQYDNKRMTELLDYIGSNKLVDDNGPILYLTLQDSLKYWE